MNRRHRWWRWINVLAWYFRGWMSMLLESSSKMDYVRIWRLNCLSVMELCCVGWCCYGALAAQCVGVKLCPAPNDLHFLRQVEGEWYGTWVWTLTRVSMQGWSSLFLPCVWPFHPIFAFSRNDVNPRIMQNILDLHLFSSLEHAWQPFRATAIFTDQRPETLPY